MRKDANWMRRGIFSLSLMLVATAGLAVPANAANTIKIGVITSTSGPLKSYGVAYTDGLDWGLNYYTHGTMKVGKATLVVTKKDDAADPAAATAFFKEMVGNGTKIIVGTASSGVALTLGPLAQQNKVLYISGPAKNDAVTSTTNKYVFRSGNTSLQDFAPLSNIKPISGKKVILFVEDNAFGAGNIGAAKLFLASKGAIFQDIIVATTATDFTPYAKQAADANGDYIFIAWSNALNAGAMFTALRQQGVFAHTRPITGLAGTATYDIYGTIFDGAKAVLTNSYFPGVVRTPTSLKLAADYAKAGTTQDLFTSDGVNAARMIVQALTANPRGDVDKAIANLEGFSFSGLKGHMQVRASDHVLIQPMFIVKLVKDGAHYKPVLVSTLANVAH
jgi:branched-chain amino acid transport system substrate-binding protein